MAAMPYPAQEHAAEPGAELWARWRVAGDMQAREALLGHYVGWARKLAAQAPVAIEQIKRVSHKGDLDEGIAAEKQGFAAVFGSEDAREGPRAFKEKRKAVYKGR